MCPIISVTPSFAGLGIEKITEQVVWVERTQVQRFKHARALKFREALELVSGQATQKIDYKKTVRRCGGAKKSTYQGRARGDNGQV